MSARLAVKDQEFRQVYRGNGAHQLHGLITVGTDYGANGVHEQDVVLGVTTATPGNYVGTTV